MSLVVVALIVAFVQLYRMRGRFARMERRIEQLEHARFEIAPPPLAQEPPRRMPARILAERTPDPAPVPEATPATEATPVPAPSTASVPASSGPWERIVVEAPEAAPPPPPPPPPEPPVAEPVAQPIAVPGRNWSFNFEDLFGRRLPIWAGGITLAIAGVLIVKYAVDAGILRIFTPWVRVICGFVFGLGLIGGAEAALRNEERVDDPRVRQALSGAGIATLYAAILIASNVYHLIGPALAFAGFAAVTAGALGLSIRFGAPSAVLGLAGGLAAPAMIGAVQPNVPLLAVYLALTIAGLAGVSRMQRWAWLGIIALLGGAGWSLWMVMASSAYDAMATLSVGGLVLLLAIGIPMLVLDGPRSTLLRSASALIGALQLALMVALGGFALLNWGLFILLAAAAQWPAWRDKGFAIIPSISLPLSGVLLAIWPDPSVEDFSLVTGALALVHGGPLLWKLWQIPSSLQRAIELCVLALGLLALPMIHFYRVEREGLFALIALGAALVPAIGIATGWRASDRQGDARFAFLTTTLALLVGCAALLALPHWLWPVAIGAIAAMLLLFGAEARDNRIEQIASTFSGAALFGLLFQAAQNGEALALVTGAVAHPEYAVIRWGLLAITFALFAWRGVNAQIRNGAFGIAGALAYGVAAQLVPGWTLPIALAVVATAMLALARLRKSAKEELNAAFFAALTVPLLVVTGRWPLPEWSRVLGLGSTAVEAHAVLRWFVLTALAILFAARSTNRAIRVTAQVAAAALGYGAVAQFMPAAYLPLIAPAGIVALAWWRKQKVVHILPAAATLLAILVTWALIPVGLWTQGALLSVGGIPMVVTAALFPLAVVLKQLLIPAVLLGLALWLSRNTLGQAYRILVTSLAAALAGIAIHTLYRLGFAQVMGSDFITTGVAQRLVWEGVLILLGWVLSRRERARPFAIALAATGALHALWYGLILHNPLWAMQVVGALPIANLLVPLVAVPAAGVVLLRTLLPAWRTMTERPVQLGAMVLVAGLAWGLLRQVFHGTLLALPGVYPTEDILRSILAIVLAVGFLLWGIRAQLRDWRIASLVLMLGAVAKVFLFDASGLEGLLRIGSFVALGFSLIGIGWLYSRQLKSDAAQVTL